MKTFIKFLLIFLPWRIKKYILRKFFNYKIHPTARIGLSYIYPQYLEMKEHSFIGHFNVGIHLDKIIIGSYSRIGRSNWITGCSTTKKSKHFSHQKDRKSELIIGNHTAITKNHHIDCTSQIKIGNFTTIAGYNSQLLTHSIDIYENRQDSHPIEIGDYCFTGTRSTLLGGCKLPSYSVLGAGAVLTQAFNKEWIIYGGVPAKPKKEIPQTAKYFSRKQGFIY